MASAFQRAYAPQPTQAFTSQGIPSALERAYAPQPTQAFTSQGVPSALERAYAPLATQQFECQVSADLPKDSQFASGDSLPVEEQIIPVYDPFVLRQTVMSYANPLRAKIILLIMLRPDFNFGSQSVMIMREYQLDDLLSEVLETYPTMPQLEESMTFAVEQLIEIEEYGKAANGLLQSLIPLYPEAGGRN